MPKLNIKRVERRLLCVLLVFEHYSIFISALEFVIGQIYSQAQKLLVQSVRFFHEIIVQNNAVIFVVSHRKKFISQMANLKYFFTRWIAIRAIVFRFNNNLSQLVFIVTSSLQSNKKWSMWVEAWKCAADGELFIDMKNWTKTSRTLTENV